LVTKKQLILAGFCIVLFGALVILVARWPAVQRVTLPDGSTVTFAGTSFGNNVSTPPIASSKRYLAFLPAPILHRLKIITGPVRPLGTNRLVIWLFVTPPASAGLWQGGVTFSLIDENGATCGSPNCWPYSDPSFGTTNGPVRQGIDVSAFPRRGRTFTLRLYSRGANDQLTQLGDLTIPNPAYHNYPDWQPMSLPATQTNGDVAITLTSLLAGLSPFEMKPAATNTEPWGQASFAFAKNGEPCADWMVDNIEFSDATGNRSLPSGWAYNDTTTGQGVFNFRTVLWPEESAWKLNVTLKRGPSTKFSDGELWSITNLPLPGINASNTFLSTTNLGGITLQLLRMVNESAMLPPGSDIQRIRLDFAPPNLPPDMRFDIVSVTGHDAETNSNAAVHPAQWGGTSDSSYNYLLASSVRTLDVTVAVYRQLTAEFVAKPSTLPATNSR
jgi:hypothetical protein